MSKCLEFALNSCQSFRRTLIHAMSCQSDHCYNKQLWKTNWTYRRHVRINTSANESVADLDVAVSAQS